MGVFRRYLILLLMLVFVCSACVSCSRLSGRVQFGASISLDEDTLTNVRQRIQSYFWQISTDKVEFAIKILDSKQDVDEQMLQIDDFIAEKNYYKALIVSPVNSSLSGIITEKAKAANMPVVFLKWQPDEEIMNSWDKICFVGFDERQSGLVQGEIVANLPDHGDINGDGVVSYVMITGNPEYSAASYLAEYSIRALTDRGIEVEELSKQNGDWDVHKAYDIAAAALSQFGDRIDVIFCNDDLMATGASQAISEAGRTVNKDIYLIGWGEFFEDLDLMDSGKMTGTVRIDDDSRAVAAAEAAIRYVQGKDNEKYIWIDYIPIVSETDQSHAN